jgi:hypothetical protein
MPEIIDQANELERQLEMPLQKCASTMRQFRLLTAATAGKRYGSAPELVAGCQRCADFQEEEELRGKHRRRDVQVNSERPGLC